MQQTPEKEVSAAGFPVHLHGFSAIDSYLGRSSSRAVHLLCGADPADLARLFEGLRYPGAGFADAAVDSGGKTWYFRCHDAPDGIGQDGHRASFGLLEFYRDCRTGRFLDPGGIYPVLRGIKDTQAATDTDPKGESGDGVLQNRSHRSDPGRAVIDGAMILARYFPNTGAGKIKAAAAGLRGHGEDAFPGTIPGAEEQRLLLTELLDVQHPSVGFEFLKESGFIAACWPELASMDDVDHSKEFHPEGNVWKHTMETLRYRKPGGQGAGFDLRLSLGLLLHDVGKPISQAASRRRFDGHAELGEVQARRFLARLGFDAQLIRDVCYLVRNHMLPAALPRLPLFRTGEKMESPLFPLLMELYRCDESSSFKGLDGYYRSSAAYRSYQKHRRNPYRSADGKKLRPE
ncbi:MAG: HD domain-containing protein [Treponema sp.]|nr:HD domain-containing protein [Treponema sp.]